MQQPVDVSAARQMMLYDANKKSALVAYLLWFFLGFFGAHRFYLGRTGSGIAMVVVTLLSFVTMLVAVGFLGFAIIGLWVVIDAFLIPGWVSANNNRLIASMG